MPELNLAEIPTIKTTRSYRGVCSPAQRSYIDRIREKDGRLSFTYQDFLNNISNYFGRKIRDTCELRKNEAETVIEDMLSRGTEGWVLRK